MEEFTKWAEKYSFDQLINKIRPNLVKPDFISSVEKTMLMRGYKKYEIINYTCLTANSLYDMITFDDIEGYIQFAALYFVIDVVHLNYKYKNTKITIISEFASKFLTKITKQIGFVSAMWMIENGHEISKIIPLVNDVSVYFQIHYLDQLVYRNEFQKAYQYYCSHEIPINYDYPNEGKTIIRCLIASSHIKEARKFVVQYCSADGIIFLPFYEDYIIEMYETSKALNNLSSLKEELNLTESNMISNYIRKYEQASTHSDNIFFDAKSKK